MESLKRALPWRHLFLMPSIISRQACHTTQLPSSGGFGGRQLPRDGQVRRRYRRSKRHCKLTQTLAEAGLLAFSGSAAQTTNAQGVVNYTINVPSNLNAAQKAQLEGVKGFKVKAILAETSGARTPVESQLPLVPLVRPP